MDSDTELSHWGFFYEPEPEMDDIEERNLDRDERAYHESQPTKDTWVTRTGERIPVREMTDSHLVNTIRMLRRQSDKYTYLEEMGGPPNGEMARDDWDWAVGQCAFLSRDEFFARIPTYPALLNEAARRKLKV